MPPHFGPPPREAQMEKLKEPKPKRLAEVPGFLWRVCKNTLRRLLYIVQLVWEAKRSLLIVMALMAAFNGVSPVISAYISANLLNKLADVLSAGIGTLDVLTEKLLPAMLLQFGYLFFVSFLNSISNMVTRISGELVTNHVKVKMMYKAKEIDVASFDMPAFYEKFENANREANYSLIQVITNTFSIISTLISVVSFIFVLAAVAWFAPLIVILLSLPSAIITFAYRKKNFQYMFFHSKDRRQMTYYSDMLMNKDTVKELRLFNLSDMFIFNYKKVFTSYFGGIRGLIVEEGIWSILTTLVTTTVNCGLFFFIAYSVVRGQGKIGDYSLYTGALTSIATCVATLVTTTSTVYESTLFIDNMILFMNEERHIKPSISNPAQVRRHVGHTIEFRHVSFCYPGTTRKVIDDVSFTVLPGDTVVLVGLNGAGKTTLLKLLIRLYDPTEGEIFLDGIDIKAYDVEQLYGMFGAIFQDFGKYAFTVTENISFGEINKPIEDSNIQTAAKRSAADAFISRLPKGYETPLMRYFEADGIEPSIGQWQKLAIARAFYSDSDILILDEPTASLDPMAEQEIFNQFDSLRKDKTSFFVSHRLSSATLATKILVLENGKLIETGDHAALMAKKGRYYQLFSTQAGRYLGETFSTEAPRDAGTPPEGTPPEGMPPAGAPIPSAPPGGMPLEGTPPGTPPKVRPPF